MAGFNLFPDSTTEERAKKMAETILARYHERTGDSLYIWELGHLVATVEIYHIEYENTPYGDFDGGKQPRAIQNALATVLNENPSRIAYKNGRQKTHKVAGWRAEECSDKSLVSLVDDVLEDTKNVTGEELKKHLQKSRPFPWE